MRQRVQDMSNLAPDMSSAAERVQPVARLQSCSAPSSCAVASFLLAAVLTGDRMIDDTLVFNGIDGR